jgi:hypothetical protein
LLIVLGITSFLTMWFKADLPILVTRFLRCMGLRRDDVEFWPDPSEYKFWVREQWSRWLSSRCRESALGRAFSHLLNCPYCVAFHLSWLCGLCVGVFISPLEASFCVTYPAVALILYRLT